MSLGCPYGAFPVAGRSTRPALIVTQRKRTCPPPSGSGDGAGAASCMLPVGQQYLRSISRTLSAMSGRFSAWASVASMKPTLSPQS